MSMNIYIFHMVRLQFGTKHEMTFQKLFFFLFISSAVRYRHPCGLLSTTKKCYELKGCFAINQGKLFFSALLKSATKASHHFILLCSRFIFNLFMESKTSLLCKQEVYLLIIIDVDLMPPQFQKMHIFFICSSFCGGSIIYAISPYFVSYLMINLHKMIFPQKQPLLLLQIRGLLQWLKCKKSFHEVNF